jgi:hypoxia up-regulated 1
MWNWSTRLFLAEARTNLTAEDAAGLPSKWTSEELDALEKTLKEHEVWLNEWVEKQKSVKMNEDPVISTTEMKARAKTLETHLQKLVKRKIPKIKKTTSSSTPVATSSSSPSESETPVPPTTVVEPESEDRTTAETSSPTSTGRPDDEL